MRRKMKMKFLVFIFSIGLFSSFVNKKEVEQFDSEFSIVKNENEIVRSWHVLSETHDMIVLLCNVCPDINFYNENEGAITSSSEERYKFKYALSQNKIVFIENGKKYFQESEFNYTIFTEKDGEYLKLISNNGKIEYKLSRN